MICNYQMILAILLSSITLSAQSEQKNNIQSIYFGGGSYYIDQQQIQELTEFLDQIDGLENYNILVHSHTDNIGSLSYNQWLSQMRSKSVIKVLEAYGIPVEFISIDDFGEVNPVYKNETWEGKLRNRRADVILIPPTT